MDAQKNDDGWYPNELAERIDHVTAWGAVDNPINPARIWVEFDDSDGSWVHYRAPLVVALYARLG